MERQLSRRDILKIAGAAGAAGTLVATGMSLPRFVPRLTPPSADAAPERRDLPQLIPTVCGMCDAHCGLLAYVEDGKLHKLDGNFYHSHSQGRICGRGSASVKLLYDPDRLRQPLKRVDEGQFQPISWEQALAEIGAKLRLLSQQYGPQTLAWVRRPDLADQWDQHFMRAFGSPNLFTDASVGYASRSVACQHTLGAVPYSDLAHARYLLVFGRNFAESIFTADLLGLMQAKEQGAKLVVVDPRLSHTAAQAHEWVPIRPGTDGALLLALMHVIVAEGLYDKDFVARYTEGFAELKGLVADKTPAWAESRCDVPAATIRRLAREFAAARPACGVDPGWHAAWGALYANSVQTARAALALNALVGSYGARGGLLLPSTPSLGRFRFTQPSPPVAPRVDGAGSSDFPLVLADHGLIQRLPELILSGQPYPLRALVANHINPARSLPNTGQAMAALKSLDLLVAIDVQLSETAELAHYVLPESTFLERLDLPAVSARTVPELALRQPVVRPLYDTRPAHQIIAEMGRAAGLMEHFQFTLEEVAGAMLSPLGVKLEDLRRQGVWQGVASEGELYGEPKLSTPGGKVRLFLPEFAAAGFDPLPGYEPPLMQPKGEGEFRLLHGREAVHTGTSTQNNAYLHQLAPENRLWINALRAARLGIGDGDPVRVASSTGEVEVKARVTEAIHPEAVFLVHGYGRASQGMRLAGAGGGANDSALLTAMAEPIGGGGALNETIVAVRRVRH